MSTLCKMKCEGIKTYESVYNNKLVVGGTVEMSVVYTEKAQYRQFANATPSGKMELVIQNPDALKQFTPGKYYNILIEESSKDG